MTKRLVPEVVRMIEHLLQIQKGHMGVSFQVPWYQSRIVGVVSGTQHQCLDANPATAGHGS
jgi:hypothetical protein